jgi:hypothetical protein
MKDPSDCSPHVPGRGLHVLAALFVVLGCASMPPPTPSPHGSTPAPAANAVSREFSAGPAWLLKCERAFTGQKQQVICGVDGIMGASSPMLARAGAESKARANLARRVRTVVKSGLVSYRALVGAGDRQHDEQHVEDTSTEITEMTLVGAKLHDTYISPSGGVWVMVYMDLNTFQAQVHSLNQFDEGMRKEIVERAKDAFSTQPAGVAP